jgi:hypothetical protein
MLEQKFEKNRLLGLSSYLSKENFHLKKEMILKKREQPSIYFVFITTNISTI